MSLRGKRILFFSSSVFVLAAFVFLWFFKREAIETPDPCACRDVFAEDSSVSVPAARAMVGVGHYNFTIQTARRLCDSAYQAEILELFGKKGHGRKGEGIGKSYFELRCPE